MRKLGMLKSIIFEYGIRWGFYRLLYSIKIKSLKRLPKLEKLYEKKHLYPTRLNLFCIDVDILRVFIKNLDKTEQERLLDIANNACRGVIKGFSSLNLDYGYPLDWQLNPLTGKRYDELKKWYEIPDFNTENGDIKVVWEASRFSHFITLARAFLLTNDEKYYRAFSEQLKDWVEKNKYGYGANYKCGQECSLRMINALLAYAIFEKVGITSNIDAIYLKELINSCYSKILSNFFYAYKCIKNNHTLSELMGMIAGAYCCGDDRQIEKAYKFCNKVIEEQFMEDGGYKQFSFNYQRLALQDIECIISMCKATGKQLSRNSIEKIRKSALLMYQCQDENGDMPNYGANDGALIFPVTSCGYRDFRPIVNAIYALTAGNKLFDDTQLQEELIWFSGKGIEQYGREKLEKVSSQFWHAGLFTLRNSDSWAMIVANGFHSRPSHMDQLHFDLWVNGVNVLCDSGTFSYASKEGRELMENSAHNTAEVNNKLQMNTYSHFMVTDWTKRKLAKIIEDSFEGNIESKNGYIHKRRVFSKGNRYIIMDKVSEDAMIHFHTPCKIIEEKNEILFLKAGRELCRMAGFVDYEIKEAYRSVYYLNNAKINDIILKVKADQELIVTIDRGERIDD